MNRNEPKTILYNSKPQTFLAVLLFFIALATFMKAALLGMLIAVAGCVLLAKTSKHSRLRLFKDEQALRTLFFVTLGLASMLVVGYDVDRLGALSLHASAITAGGVILLALAVIEMAQVSRRFSRKKPV